MSKTTVKINRITKKLEDISGLDGDYVQERLEKIENLVNKTVEEIEKHCNENEINGSIFENTSADEMFEKLEYKRKVTRRYIVYYIKNGILIPDSRIIFDKRYKWVSANFNLDMQELQAINKKVKELRLE